MNDTSKEKKPGKSDLLKQAAALEAKAKSLRRKEAEFWKMVEDRQKEVRERLSMSDSSEEDGRNEVSDSSEEKREKAASDILERIFNAYGVATKEEREQLFYHITSARQVAYYNDHVKPRLEGAAADHAE